MSYGAGVVAWHTNPLSCHASIPYRYLFVYLLLSFHFSSLFMVGESNKGWPKSLRPYTHVGNPEESTGAASIKSSLVTEAVSLYLFSLSKICLPNRNNRSILKMPVIPISFTLQVNTCKFQNYQCIYNNKSVTCYHNAVKNHKVK